jgi:hypothetical protein
MAVTSAVRSASSGDPAHHRPLAELEAGLERLPDPPVTGGRVVLLVRRVSPDGLRETLPHVVLSPDLGVPGDAWGRRAERDTRSQLTVMQSDVAGLIANGQPLTLFGDNLFVDLDLSSRNLPIGSRLRMGGALLEVSPQPHNGCGKFRTRFGADALRLVSNPELRYRNLRGIYLRVLEEGEVRTGDSIAVIARAGLQR